MRRGGKSSQNGQVSSKGRSPEGDICSFPAGVLRKSRLGKGGAGKRWTGLGERSPQLCLLTIPSPEQGFSMSSFQGVSQIFLAQLMGERSLLLRR